MKCSSIKKKNLATKSDEHATSPENISALLNKQVMRIKFISLEEVDSIILSADIPGNEQLQGQDNSKSFNPLTPMSDQDRISPYNINAI